MSIRLAIPVLCLIAAVAPLAHAAVQSIVFDAGLTNSTGWAYVDVKAYKKGYCLAKAGAQFVSPEFHSAVTSLTVSVQTTSVADGCRRVLAAPIRRDGSRDDSLSVDLTPAASNKIERATAAWPAAENVRRFAIYSTKGKAGNIYPFSADIASLPERFHITFK